MWANNSPGVTGFAAYSLGVLKTRLELSWQQSTGIEGGIALGIALDNARLSLEPHIYLPITQPEDVKPRFGVRLGVQFGT